VNDKKDLIRVKLIDLGANTRVFEIPKFGARPAWISWQYKTYVFDAESGAYIERFGYPMSFEKEPVKA
jgi:hypothetical protein